jgi:anti-sigma regulatory factor (Ser/Thr protein kinase)
VMSFVEDALSLEVPCDRHAPMAVRQVLADMHDGGWSLDDGLLVASELVTNAVRHSGCSDAHNLTVDIARREGNLLIAVHDPGLSAKIAEPVSTESSEVGGWGLRIIERLSARWGSERPDGYRVWAELPAVG